MHDPPRALVADDSAPTRDIIESALKECGFAIVASCQDGREAVRRAQILRPDLVTMDVVMPQMSGKDAAKAIHELVPDAKILMVTSMSQRGVIDELKEMGFGVLIKPIVHSHQVMSALVEMGL